MALDLPPDHEELVLAWNRWEDRPGGIEEAVRMEKACQLVADELGVQVNEFRNRLSAERRRGHGPEASLRIVLGADPAAAWGDE